MKLPLSVFLFAVAASAAFPCPFKRALTDGLTGNDVLMVQNLITRSPYVTAPVNKNSQYDADTKNAVTQFQQGEGITASGIFDEVTAVRLLEKHSYDGYKDDGQILPGYLYKVHIPVHRNRSLESVATLYDSQMNVLLKFLVRAKGQNAADGSPLSELCSNGNTPTGLMLFDLNSPEDAPTYGPFPINRCVSGLRGNAAFLLPTFRSGILMHTGEWTGWRPPFPMPDSHGCIHAWPEAIRAVWQLLTSRLGVAVHENPYGTWPYPYTPQGLISIEQVD